HLDVTFVFCEVKVLPDIHPKHAHRIAEMVSNNEGSYVVECGLRRDAARLPCLAVVRGGPVLDFKNAVRFPGEVYLRRVVVIQYYASLIVRLPFGGSFR